MSSLKSLIAKTLLQTVIVRRKIGVMFLKLNWGRKHSERYGSGHIKRRQPGTCGLSVTTFFHQVLNYYYLTVYIMFKPKMSLG